MFGGAVKTNSIQFWTTDDEPIFKIEFCFCFIFFSVRKSLQGQSQTLVSLFFFIYLKKTNQLLSDRNAGWEARLGRRFRIWVGVGSVVTLVWISSLHDNWATTICWWGWLKAPEWAVKLTQSNGFSHLLIFVNDCMMVFAKLVFSWFIQETKTFIVAGDKCVCHMI